MLKHYLTMTIAVLKRRPFYTAISLFGISFTLLVLMVVTAMADHALAPMAPESRQARMLGVHSARMYGPDNAWSSNGGYMLFDKYARTLPGVEELTIFSSFQTVSTYLGDQRITSNLKRTDDAYWRVFDFTFLEGEPVRPGRRRRRALRRGDHAGDARAPVSRSAGGARQELRGRRAVVPRRRRRRERAGHPLRAVRGHVRAASRRRRRMPTSGRSWVTSRRSRWRAPATTCRSSARSSTPGCPASSCPTRPTRRSSRRSRRSTTASPASRRWPIARARSARAPS